MSDRPGASAKVRFHGTGIALTTVVGPGQGSAELWVDGVLVRTIDGNAPERAFGVVEAVEGLADGVHLLRVVVLGPASASRPARVTVDAVTVVP